MQRVAQSAVVEGTFTSRECFVLERNSRAIALLLAVTAIGAVAGVVCIAHAPQWAWLPFMALAFGGTAVYSMVRYRMFARRLGGELRAGPQGVMLDGMLLVPSETLASGFVRPGHRLWSREQYIVSLLKSDGGIALEVLAPDDDRGRSLLAALGLEPGRATVEHVMRWHLLGKTWVIVLLSWTPILIVAPLLMIVSEAAESLGVPDGSPLSVALTWIVLASAATAGVLAFLASRTRLTIGADGLRVRSFGRTRFVPYSAVERVTRWLGKPYQGETRYMSEGIDVVVRSGRPIRLRTLDLRLRHGDVAGDFVADEIEGALRAYSAAAVEPMPGIDRAGRSAREWMRALREIASGGHDPYRAAAVRAEDLWTIVECPSAHREQRAAAAVVLGLLPGERAVPRLGRVARTLADRSLGAVLEAVVSGNDAAVDAALVSLVRREP